MFNANGAHDVPDAYTKLLQGIGAHTVDRSNSPRRTQSSSLDGSQRGRSPSGNKAANQKASQTKTPKSEQKAKKYDKYKHTFDDYWNSKDVSSGLKRGTLIQGPIRINPKAFEDAYVEHPGGTGDVYINGSDRNRAFPGDVVAVEIYPREMWKVRIDELEYAEHSLANLCLTDDGSDVIVAAKNVTKEAATVKVDDGVHSDASDDGPDVIIESEETIVNETSAEEVQQGQQQKQKGKDGDTIIKNGNNKTPKRGQAKMDDVTWRTASVGDLDNAQSPIYRLPVVQRLAQSPGNILKRLPDSFLQRTGKVVAIIEQKHGRAGVGYLKPVQRSKNASVALFSPMDSRLPRMHVSLDQCPPGFRERPADFANTLFVGRCVSWTDNIADGELARSLGEAGQIEPETEGMLLENDVDCAPFSSEVASCLPLKGWKIGKEIIDTRRDLRQKCIFTIDPSTARDLDDALSVDAVDGGFEVGVHIADVSYFVKDGTVLNEVAASRATSVYLVHRMIPMLPRMLCEDLCSLSPGTDRLAFSVIWTMDEDGQIMGEWFGRTVINSCVKLSYDHAQGMIEEPNRVWTENELPTVHSGFSSNDIRDRVLLLDKLAKKLRERRFENGALRLDQVKLHFVIDPGTGMPSGYSVYQQRDSNKLVEEFMLLANMAVAHKIYKHYPDTALLRLHPPPAGRALQEIVELCKCYGIFIDASSAGALQESLLRYTGQSGEEQARIQILTSFCSRPMQNARYFCTGCVDDENSFRHYALNVPLYTHFTSPIRRYPDIVVHRMLAAAIEGLDGDFDKKTIQKQASHSNDKKLNAKRVSDMSNDLFFSVFVQECGPLEEKGMVMAVLSHSFDVLVLSLGVIKRVYCENLALDRHEYQKNGRCPQLMLYWKEPTCQQKITLFTSVTCILSSEPKQCLRIRAVIKPS